MLNALKRLSISTKLSGVLGIALLALCVMGAIGVSAVRQIQELGSDRYAEAVALSNIETAVLVDIERAISAVHSAPSELDLGQLKAKQERFQALLGETRKSLQATLAKTASTSIKASSADVIAAIGAFEDASKKVFDFAASFAQPDAIAALSGVVAPAEIAVQTALQQFHAAADKNGAAKEATIQAAIATVTQVVIGLAMLLVVAIASLGYVTVARGVARPITALNEVMTKLSSGDLNVEVPYASRLDEVGAMAKAVEVFKRNAIERIRLEAAQRDTDQRAAAQRKTEMWQFADKFEAAISTIVATVSSASAELEVSASTLTRTAETTQSLSIAVAAASEEASANVQSVASASEELAASVNEISRQVHESRVIAGAAVAQAEATDTRITNLSRAASHIGDVVKLITSVAQQTNLLALNATIEAARAGEAGKGFAIVAQEVKALAAQTAQATSQIGNQIAAVQAATAESVTAIREIGETISRIAEIALTIASAVEEQSSATSEISRNIQQAAQGTTLVASNITDVNRGANETGSASAQVLTSAQSLSNESRRLKGEVEKFLTTVRAA
jgi:methyl-accepting chemotaxis protein